MSIVIESAVFNFQAVDGYNQKLKKGLKFGAFESVGKLTAKDSGYGYYRKCRFGKVLGYISRNGWAKVSVNSFDQRIEHASLRINGSNIIYRDRGGMIRRGIIGLEMFPQALSKVFAVEDSFSNECRQVRQEVMSWCYHMVNSCLHPWQEPVQLYSLVEGKHLMWGDDVFKLMFPLWKGGVAFKSDHELYPIFRGETNIKTVVRKLYGNAGKQSIKAFERAMNSGARKRHFSTILGFKKAGWVNLHEMGTLNYSADLSQLAKVCSQQRLVGFIQGTTNTMFLDDAVTCLKRIESSGLLESIKVDKEVKCARHLHDALAMFCNEALTQDCHLWHHEYWFKYHNVEFAPGATIVFPELESQIKAWGRELHICIGGYGERINNGEAICFAVYLDGKLHACVEIGLRYGTRTEPKGWRILQADAAHHTDIRPDIYQAMEEALKLDEAGHIPQPIVNRQLQPVAPPEDLDTNSVWKECVYKTSLAYLRKRQELAMKVLKGQVSEADANMTKAQAHDLINTTGNNAMVQANHPEDIEPWWGINDEPLAIDPAFVDDADDVGNADF